MDLGKYQGGWRPSGTPTPRPYVAASILKKNMCQVLEMGYISTKYLPNSSPPNSTTWNAVFVKMMPSGNTKSSM